MTTIKSTLYMHNISYIKLITLSTQMHQNDSKHTSNFAYIYKIKKAT